MRKNNVREILENVQNCINELEELKRNRSYDYDYKRVERTGWDRLSYQFKTRAVYEELSIFDWWTDKITISRLKDMEKFLKVALDLGYEGYCCFKVGVSGCANGMWAHKEETTDGFSPDGAFLYKSFTPVYNYWDEYVGEEKSYNSPQKLLSDMNGLEYDAITTIKQLKELHNNINR